MISIIIPTLNEISVIERTLKLFKGTSRRNLEVIVSDGGSTDGTVAVARKYADKVVEKGEGRQTIGMGKNEGEAVSTGDCLAFFDADITIPSPDEFFDTVLEVFGHRPEVVAITGYLKVLPEYETPADRFFFRLVNVTHYIQNNIFRTGAAAGEFQIIRRSAFEKLGGYRKELAVSEDQDMFRRLAKIGRTFFDPRLVVYHTGRRAHKIGWPKLLYQWMINDVSVRFFGKSFNDVWKEVR